MARLYIPTYKGPVGSYDYSWLVQLYKFDLDKLPWSDESIIKELSAHLNGKGRPRSKRNELVLASLPYALSLARKFARPGVLLSDLIQQANIGLLEAADKFDPKRKVFFLSFATSQMYGAMQEAYNHLTVFTITKDPYYAIVKRGLDKLQPELGIFLSPEDVARDTKLPLVTVRRVITQLRLLKGAVNVGQSLKDDVHDVFDNLIVEQSFLSPEQIIDAKDTLELVQVNVDRFLDCAARCINITKRKHTMSIVRARYGLDNGSYQERQCMEVVKIKKFWTVCAKAKIKENKLWLINQIARIRILTELLYEK